MSAQANVYRGATLDEVLPKIRAELGADAIILAEREGVVGGIGGFFARKCVEVEAVPRAGGAPAEPMPTPRQSVPSRVATSAYAAAGPRADALPEAPFANALPEPPRELTFADLLAQAGPPATDLPPVPDEFIPLVMPPEPTAVRIDVLDEPAAEPLETRLETPLAWPAVDDETAVLRALHHAGFPDGDADELVRHAMLHARPFAAHAALRDVVRETLAEALHTPLGWKAKRRVLVLAGIEGAGASEAAAALCAGYARVGLTVAALGLDGVRAAVSLATHTEDAAVAVGIAEGVDDVRRALPRLGRPDLLVAIAPTIIPGDDARLAQTAELLAELPAHDLHLVLPAGATAGDAQAAHAALAGTLRVKGVLPVALDEAATIGGVVSLALRERLELRWTASGAGAVRLATAEPSDIAWRTLQ